MTQALYRKWRPQLWDEVISQEHIIHTLKNAVATDRVAHAYLFSGPRGTGKTTAARLLAKAVNCLNLDSARRPCNECAHCKAVNESRFMDLIEIDAASNTGVDDVRELRDKINFSPSQGKFKVYIIDEVHMLSNQAFNALLKTLEEPPPHVIFILATTEIHKIPATVLSRCQRHEFRRVPPGEIIRHLTNICTEEKIEADPEALAVIARQSTGGMRDAISLLDQLSSTGGRITIELAQTVLGTATSQSVLALIQAAIDHQPGHGLDEIQHALDGGADVRALARQLVEYLRNLMLIQMGNGAQLEAPNDVRAQMNAHAVALSSAEVLRMLRAFNAAATDQRGGGPPSLGLELAFAEILEPAAQPQFAVATSAQHVPAAAPRPPPSQPPAVGRLQPVAPGSQTTIPAAVPGPAQPGEAPKSQTGVSLEQVTKAWKQVANLLRTKDPNLMGLVNSSKVLEIREGVLIVSFASDILQKRFDRPEGIDLVRKTLHEVLGRDLPIQTVVAGNKNALPANVKPGGMVAAASQLGGEIVDIQ